MIGKGLTAEVADKIWEFVQLKGRPLELLEVLKGKLEGETNEFIVQAINEVSLLFKYVDFFGASDMVFLFLLFINLFNLFFIFTFIFI